MSIAVLLFAAGPLSAGDPPRVRELRVQQVGDTTYFHVRFDTPPKLRPSAVEQVSASDLQRWRLAQLPQLVPQDGHARAIYPRVLIPAFRPTVGFDGTARDPVPVEGLEFVGQVAKPGRARFLLHYSTVDVTVLAAEPDQTKRVEVPVELDFAAAARPGRRRHRLTIRPAREPGLTGPSPAGGEPGAFDGPRGRERTRIGTGQGTIPGTAAWPCGAGPPESA
jgi:hypothetical protein